MTTLQFWLLVGVFLVFKDATPQAAVVLGLIILAACGVTWAFIL